eukprot:GHVP01050327.1.p1 GENE.GHVP01050327.1~~GHVP01050327.1.p1  ORF type:complete len:365 (+),score=60.00 GHVP01050327.1:224-1318(+)
MSDAKEVPEDEYLKSIYAKYSGISPVQTARVVRSIRWGIRCGKLLYGSEIFLPTEELLKKEQKRFDKAIFKQSKFMHCHLVEQEAGTNFIIETDHILRVANFLRKTQNQGNCPELEDEIKRMREGHPCDIPYLTEVERLFRKHNVHLVDVVTAPAEEFWEIKAKLKGSIMLARAAEVKQKAGRHAWRNFETKWGRIGKMSKAYQLQDSRCLFMFRLPSFSIGSLKEETGAKDKGEDRCIYCNKANANNGRHLIQNCSTLPQQLAKELQELKNCLPEAAILLEDEDLREAKAGKQETQKVLSWMKEVLVESAKRAEEEKKEKNRAIAIKESVNTTLPAKSHGLEATIRLLQEERLPADRKKTSRR